MKVTRILAVLLVLLLSFTGCTSRNNNNNNNTSNPVTDEVSDLVSEAGDMLDDLGSKVEEGMSEIGDALNPDDDGDKSDVDDRDDNDGDGNYEADEDGAVNDESSNLDDEDESVAAMSTDYSQIGALDAEKMGWGPGGPTDAKNRPDGATVYQERYGKYGAYFIAPDSEKIYLTFDEGYENSYTDDILDTLKEKNVPAVFFITYDYALTEPELVKRMVDEGHVLGNHSTKHPSFPDLPLEEAVNDIRNLHDYVREEFGYDMTLFRFPMGEFNEQTLSLVQSLNYQSVFWSVAYRDWEVDNQPAHATALETLTSRCHPGAIYLLHAVSQTNAEILGEFIDVTRNVGYTFADWDVE